MSASQYAVEYVASSIFGNASVAAHTAEYPGSNKIGSAGVSQCAAELLPVINFVPWGMTVCC